jgi:hypothetical protein
MIAVTRTAEDFRKRIAEFRETATDTRDALFRRRDNLRTRRRCLFKEPGWIGLWSRKDEVALGDVEVVLEALDHLLRF